MQNTFGLEIYAANRQFFCRKSAVTDHSGGRRTERISCSSCEYDLCDRSGRASALRMRKETWTVVAVSSGFVEMINNRAKLFCLTVERPEEIDIRRAEEARDRAEEQLRQQQSIVEYHRSQAALARAMTRLRVTKELK